MTYTVGTHALFNKYLTQSQNCKRSGFPTNDQVEPGQAINVGSSKMLGACGGLKVVKFEGWENDSRHVDEMLLSSLALKWGGTIS